MSSVLLLFWTLQTTSGIDTVLGTLFESSTRLSEGQNQRLAIMRSIYSDAMCVILDEPTSYLDAKTECDFYEYILSSYKDRGCVIISHRLAVAHIVDTIIVVDDGKVIEHGSHNELIKINGLYQQLYEKQSFLYNH